MSNYRAYALVGGADLTSILWIAGILLLFGIMAMVCIILALRNIGRIE